jgi:hypothetical protein
MQRPERRIFKLKLNGRMAHSDFPKIVFVVANNV